MIDGFEDGDLAHACAGESFVHVIEFTYFKGNNFAGSSIDGFVDGAISTLADFVEFGEG